MNNLNSILNLNLYNDSIFEIDEEKLLLMKSENYYAQTNLYFYLQNKLLLSENNDEKAYISYLISYYLMIVLTPICYEELAYNYIKISLELSNNSKYKEWALIFATLENPFMSQDIALNFANAVLKENPQSQIANTIVLMMNY